MAGTKQLMPYVLINQSQAVFQIVLFVLVEHGNTIVDIDVHGELAPLPLTQNQVAVHMELIVGDELANLGHEQLAGDNEDIHGSQVARGSGEVNGHIGDVALAVLFQSQIQTALAVGKTGLCHHGNVFAAGDMGIDHLVHVHIAQDGGICGDHIVFIGILQKVHAGVQSFQLAAIAVGGTHGVGSQEFQSAFTGLQAPLFTGTDVVQQRLVVVAAGNADVADACVDHVGQVEVYLTVTAAKGNTALAALIGQRAHVSNIGENNTHYVHCDYLPYSMSPGASTELASTTEPLEVTLIFFFSLGP